MSYNKYKKQILYVTFGGKKIKCVDSQGREKVRYVLLDDTVYETSDDCEKGIHWKQCGTVCEKDDLGFWYEYYLECKYENDTKTGETRRGEKVTGVREKSYTKWDGVKTVCQEGKDGKYYYFKVLDIYVCDDVPTGESEVSEEYISGPFNRSDCQEDKVDWRLDMAHELVCQKDGDKYYLFYQERKYVNDEPVDEWRISNEKVDGVGYNRSDCKDDETEWIIDYDKEPVCVGPESDGKYYKYYQERKYVNGVAQDEWRKSSTRYDSNAYTDSNCTRGDIYWNVKWVIDEEETPCDKGSEGDEKWEDEAGEYICEGYKKYQKQYKYVLRDCEWVKTSETRKGSLIDNLSKDCGYEEPTEETWEDSEDFIYVPATENVDTNTNISPQDRSEGAWYITDIVGSVKVTRTESEYDSNDYDCLENVREDSCSGELTETVYTNNKVWNGFNYYGEDVANIKDEMYYFPNEPTFVPAKSGSKTIKYTTDGSVSAKNYNTLHYNGYTDESYDVGEYGELKEYTLKSNDDLVLLNGFLSSNSSYEIKGILSVDLSELDTSKVTNFSTMFSGNENLRWVNVRNLDTSSMIHCENCFYNCKSLVNLNLSGWHFDLQHIGYDEPGSCDCSNMFYGCENLVSLDLSSFVPSESVGINCNTKDMFKGCDNLRYIKCDKRLKDYLLGGWKSLNGSASVNVDFDPALPERALTDNGEFIWDTETTTPKQLHIDDPRESYGLNIYSYIYAEERGGYTDAWPGDLIAFDINGNVTSFNIINPTNPRKYLLHMENDTTFEYLIPIGIVVATMSDNAMLMTRGYEHCFDEDTITVMSLYNMSVTDKENGCKDFYGDDINIASYTQSGIQYRTMFNYVGLYDGEISGGRKEKVWLANQICKFATDGYSFDRASWNDSLSFYSGADTNRGEAYLLPPPYTSNIEPWDKIYYEANIFYYGDGSPNNVFNEVYGEYNTNALYDSKNNGNDAIECCKKYRIEHDEKGIAIDNWYLPSAMELGYMYHNRKYIKQAIEKLHDFMIPASYIDVDFVSSTFYNKDICYKMTKLGRLTQCQTNNTQSKVRAFLHINPDIINKWYE